MHSYFYRLKVLIITFAAGGLLAGCGVATDMIKDNEWRFSFVGTPSFISPVKLKVGVAPFADDIGLGSPEAGKNIAKLLTVEFALNDNLTVVSPDDVEAAVRARGFKQPLEPAQAAEIGRDLGLNALITGSISDIKKYQIRKGWRRIARVVTSQKEYVDAMLAVNAVDSATGIVLVSRANIGQYQVGGGEKELFPTNSGPVPPSQESIENSLDSAIKESYHRTLEGLATLPFKARVVSSSTESATINFGQDVGLKKGRKFVMLSVDSVITNPIGNTYQIMGAPTAHLVVTEISGSQSSLKITEGSVAPGDYIQAVD